MGSSNIDAGSKEPYRGCDDCVSSAWKMSRRERFMRKVAMLTVLVVCGLYAAAWAGPKATPDIRGWERGSEYD